MNDRDIMQQALDALEMCKPDYPNTTPSRRVYNSAITALRERLAQPVQEQIHCKHKRENNGVCPHHNLQCGWPQCNEQPAQQQELARIPVLIKRIEHEKAQAQKYFELYNQVCETAQLRLKEIARLDARLAAAQPQQEPVLWRNAAIRVGEELSSVGPDGYYGMTAQQWLDWAMEQQPVGKTSLAQPNEFNPDWDAMAVMVEEQQRMAKRIEELEAMLERQTARIVDLQTHIENLTGEE